MDKPTDISDTGSLSASDSEEALLEALMRFDVSLSAASLRPSLATLSVDALLDGASLDGASLDGASLDDASLDDASLDDGAFSAPSSKDAAEAAMDRYVDMGLIGAGGMGQVRRVWDQVLRRKLAMKLISSPKHHDPQTLARFAEEAQITAQLEHPSIVPVHDFGVLADGRVYFTMKEVRGETMTATIRALHVQRSAETTSTARPFRRLIDVLVRVCEAVSYSHARGVLHLDLKPSNVMIGEFGEVLVMDWGLARLKAELNPAERTASGSPLRPGAVAGTPAYMAPEQAAGRSDEISACSDIFALGAILAEVLSGAPPRQGDSWRDLLEEAQIMPVAFEPSLGDDVLVGICQKAMAWHPSSRYQSVEALKDALLGWLDGVQRREQAQRLVDQVQENLPSIQQLQHEAAETAARASAARDALPRAASLEDKAEIWALEDRAAQLQEDAIELTTALERRLHASFTYDPRHIEAHALAARWSQRDHQRAEARSDVPAARRAQAALLEHAHRLPAPHPERPGLFAYLKGDGALSLHTDPPGATVSLHRFVQKDRRLQPVFERVLGQTPLQSVSLPMGSYLLLIEAEGFHPTRYPVQIGRQQHWDGVAPGGSGPEPIPMMPLGSLGPDDLYVPAGWFQSGTNDVNVLNALPARHVWMDGFIIKRHPVTHGEFITFLNDLVEQGRTDEAEKWAPHYHNATRSHGRDAHGRFYLQPDAEGELWSPDWPVFLIDWEAARAYAGWLAQREDQLWRLPFEWEWEKGARGVDGRTFPWGDHFEANFCNMRLSLPDGLSPVSIRQFPTDVSPYGLRGAAGNCLDICLDPFRKGGPRLDAGRMAPYTEADVNLDRRVMRGGTWTFGMLGSTSIRFLIETFRTRSDASFRLCRPASGLPGAGMGRARP